MDFSSKVLEFFDGQFVELARKLQNKDIRLSCRVVLYNHGEAYLLVQGSNNLNLCIPFELMPDWHMFMEAEAKVVVTQTEEHVLKVIDQYFQAYVPPPAPPVVNVFLEQQ